MCNQTFSKNNRHGSALEHGKAHEKDHRVWSRRSFLRNAGLTGGMSMMLGNVPLTSMTASPLGFLLSGANDDRVLVLIRLKGGNDGLNTIVPLNQYGQYINNRPNIGWSQNQLFDLDLEYAMPNVMEDLYPMWQEGMMKVVHSVGYPDQNLSHFRSSDIWASASNANVEDDTGWLGRLFDCQYPDFLTDPPPVPAAIQIGGFGDQAFRNDDGVNMALVVRDPEELFQIAENGALYDVTNLPPCTYGEQLGYMRAVANSTFIYADVIKEAYDASTSTADTYVGQLGQQLSLVARLIKGNLGTKVYMVSLDGFDTHAGQVNRHTQLLSQVARNVKAFYDDLNSGGVGQNVLSMTFSEFGRRIEQNASNGTDHGAASPMLLFGEGLNGSGFVGNGPDLQNLDPIGNLVFDVDFRRIYATLLENWCCVDGGKVDAVMGQSFSRLDELGLACNAVPSTYVPQPSLWHQARYHGDGQITIHYRIPQSANVKIEVFNILGQPIQTLVNHRLSAGEYQAGFRPVHSHISTGQYVYRIQAGKQMASGKMQVAN